MRFAGELAALVTAFCWAIGSNFFTAAGRRMGSAVTNRLRITAAMVFVGVALLVTRGSPWPTWASGEQVMWLSLSGLVGFVFGDFYLFRSLVILGPGRAAILASLAPLFTAFLGWPVLGEVPGPLTLLGMALTLGGIGWVLYERQQHDSTPVHAEGSVWVGVIAGVLGAIGQAGGFVLSKLALRTGLDALSATVIRICAAAVAVWILAVLWREIPRTLSALRDRRGTMFMLGGSFFGPFLGVTLSLVALQLIQAGVAASIIAFNPILTILLSARFHGERLTWRTMAGAIIAVSGVVVLFMR
jgi:drug/metabolite transporter (DMT)-like permease